MAIVWCKEDSVSWEEHTQLLAIMDQKNASALRNWIRAKRDNSYEYISVGVLKEKAHQQPWIIYCLSKEWMEGVEILLQDMSATPDCIKNFQFSHSGILHYILGCSPSSMEPNRFEVINRCARLAIEAGVPPEAPDQSTRDGVLAGEWALRRGNSEGFSLWCQAMPWEDFKVCQPRLEMVIHRLKLLNERQDVVQQYDAACRQREQQELARGLTEKATSTHECRLKVRL